MLEDFYIELELDNRQSEDVNQTLDKYLAGHRSQTFGVHFNRLDELEIGHEYGVVTLITCHPLINPDSRLIVPAVIR